MAGEEGARGNLYNFFLLMPQSSNLVRAVIYKAKECFSLNFANLFDIRKSTRYFFFLWVRLFLWSNRII